MSGSNETVTFNNGCTDSDQLASEQANNCVSERNEVTGSFDHCSLEDRPGPSLGITNPLYGHLYRNDIDTTPVSDVDASETGPISLVDDPQLAQYYPTAYTDASKKDSKRGGASQHQIGHDVLSAKCKVSVDVDSGSGGGIRPTADCNILTTSIANTSDTQSPNSYGGTPALPRSYSDGHTSHPRQPSLQLARGGASRQNDCASSSGAHHVVQVVNLEAEPRDGENIQEGVPVWGDNDTVGDEVLLKTEL